MMKSFRFAGLALLAAAAFRLFPACGEDLSFSFEFPASDVTLTPSDDGATFVELKDGAYGTANPGKPDLPFRDVSVRLPSGTFVDSFSVEVGESVVLAEGVTPVCEQPPVPLDGLPRESARVSPDAVTYASSDPYPALRGEYLSTGSMRHVRLAAFRLSPVWYVGAEKRLCLATKITLKISTGSYARPLALAADASVASPSALFESAANSLVINPTTAADSPRRLGAVSKSGSGCQYLVITTRALAADAGRLADFRSEFDHVTSAVVTIEDIKANTDWSDLRPDGKTDVPTKIRNCIKWYVQNRGTEYVVLAGDDKVVPKREVRVAEQELGHTDAPSDLYYSDLDGDWDENKDGTYGYSKILDGGDLLPDVIVGRIPVQTSSQLADYVDKVIAYEQETTDDSDIVRKSLLIGYTMWQDLERTSTGWSVVEEGKRGSSVSSITETFGDGLQEISDRAVGLWVNDTEFWLRRLNKTYHRTYRPNLRTTFCSGSATSWDDQQVGDYNQTGGADGSVQQVLDRGYHQVFLNSHGLATSFSIEGTKTLTSGATGLYKSQDAELLKGRADFVYAESCHNGAFDSLSDPCLSEAFLRAKGGSLAYIACSRESWGTKMSSYWTTQDSFRGVSKNYVQQFWKQIFQQGVKKLGPAFAAHKAALVSSCGNAGAVRWVQLLTNLLGDPLLTYHLPPADESNPRQDGKPGLVTILRDDLPEATASSLTVRVAVDEIPLGSSASVALEYSKSANFDSGVTSVSVASAVRRCDEFERKITGLSPDTTYYFRAKMTMNGSTHTSPFSCGFKTQRADYVSPTPVITPSSCTFAPYVEVNVASAVPDVVIRYTTDGSAPTSASPVWTGTLVVDDNMTISACAYRDNVKVGMVSQARYAYDTERMGQKGDAFADPIVIRGSSGSHVIGDFGPYSIEEGEIDHANGASVLTKTGWYEWTAPGTGTVTFKGKFTSESVIYSVSLAAYSGDCMDKLKQLDAYGMKSGEALGGGVSFAAQQGTTYRIVVASKSKILKDASFTLNWSGDLVVGSDPVLDPARAPIIELPSCSFSSATNVTLACRTPGSTIRYTTDGSDPTESSPVYAQPIRLTRSVTLRARAYKSGMKPSAVVSAAYVCSAVDVPDPTPSGDGYSNYRMDDGTPQSVLLSYYDGPDTRGFAWQTSTNVTKGALWLLAGSFDASADSRFATNKVATAASVKHSDCYTHKAHLADIRPGVYSYRVGEDGRYAYGSFVVKASANPFVALNVNDMQTKEVDKISCWDRVVSAAKSVLGGPSGVDMILTGGDVIDGGTKYSDYTEWGVVVDRSRTAFPDVAWMMASGNHDTKLYDSCVDENYRCTASGNRGCHSADVGNVHLVTLPFANGLSDTVGSWLQEDLAVCTSKWRIVVMHFGPYTTVDNGYNATADYVKKVSGIFAKGKVDLVLQAHDHGYSKTLPYLWSGAGYATSDSDRAATVNVSPTVESVGGEDYYKDPEGTVYVSAGCAGHRVGENKGYATSTYKSRGTKIFVDTIKVGANAGAEASLVPDTQMFGVLRVDGDKLAYDWYLADSNGVATRFDSLRLLKTVTSGGEEPDPGPGPGPGPGPSDGDGDYYVSPTGSDANTGTSEDSAFATIACAVSRAQAGQTVRVLAGTYPISTEISVNKAISIVGEGWTKTVILQTTVATNENTRCITLDGGARLEGVTLTGGKCKRDGAGVWIKDGTVSWCCISNNVLKGDNYSGGGVSFASGKGRIDHSLVAGNVVCGTGNKSSYGAGIGAGNNGQSGSSTAGDVVIDTCLVRDNVNTYGVGGGIGFKYADSVVSVLNCTVVGNSCNQPEGGGVYFLGCKANAKLMLVNDIIADNRASTSVANLLCQEGFLDTDRSYACLVPGDSGSKSYEGVTVLRDKSVVAALAAHGFSSAAPAFKNAAKGNYRPAEGSAAVGKGVAYTGIGTDLEGKAFAAPPSIGCYEYGAAVPRPTLPTYIEGRSQSVIDRYGVWSAKYGADEQSVHEESFLLDCGPTAQDLAAAKAAFRIVSIVRDEASGRWTCLVTGDVGEGEAYGNGYVRFRSVKARFPGAGESSDFFIAILDYAPYPER